MSQPPSPPARPGPCPSCPECSQVADELVRPHTAPMEMLRRIEARRPLMSQLSNSKPMLRHITRISCCALLASSAMPVFAQSGPPSEIIVTGARIRDVLAERILTQDAISGWCEHRRRPH